MLRDEEKINELKRIMATVDGRDFIYQFFLDSCGVDFAVGIPSVFKNEYNQGIIKPAIDMMNLLVYNCYENFMLMIKEQSLRSKQKENDND